MAPESNTGARRLLWLPNLPATLILQGLRSLPSLCFPRRIPPPDKPTEARREAIDASAPPRPEKEAAAGGGRIGRWRMGGPGRAGPTPIRWLPGGQVRTDKVVLGNQEKTASRLLFSTPASTFLARRGMRFHPSVVTMTVPYGGPAWEQRTQQAGSVSGAGVAGVRVGSDVKPVVGLPHRSRPHRPGHPLGGVRRARIIEAKAEGLSRDAVVGWIAAYEADVVCFGGPITAYSYASRNAALPQHLVPRPIRATGRESAGPHTRWDPPTTLSGSHTYRNTLRRWGIFSRVAIGPRSPAGLRPRPRQVRLLRCGFTWNRASHAAASPTWATPSRSQKEATDGELRAERNRWADPRLSGRV